MNKTQDFIFAWVLDSLCYFFFARLIDNSTSFKLWQFYNLRINYSLSLSSFLAFTLYLYHSGLFFLRFYPVALEFYTFITWCQTQTWYDKTSPQNSCFCKQQNHLWYISKLRLCCWGIPPVRLSLGSSNLSRMTLTWANLL